jgi:hypothetical protein
VAVSSWFCVPSVHVAGWHTEAVQTVLAHSTLLEQPAPGQAAQIVPPQSVSLSSPLRMPSVQLGAQGEQLAPPQSVPLSSPLRTPSVQLGAQGEQLAPPQSVPVSPWFCTPSEQLASAQLASRHTGWSQPGPGEHVTSSAHAGQLGPPQSTPSSSPSRS